MRRPARQEPTVENEVHDNEPLCGFINKHASKVKDLMAKKVFEKNLLISFIVVSVSLDPLFFYVPVVNSDSYCLGLDNNLRIITVVFRTFIDGAYIMLLWHLRHELASTERERRHKRYQRVLSGIAAILAVLPLPQVAVYDSSWRLRTVKLLKFIVIVQLVPRIFLIIRTYKFARQRNYSRINMWLAAAFYLSLFTLASHALGAFWYLRVIERNMDCWRKACKTHGSCGVSSFYCDGNMSNNGYLDEFCSIPPASNSTFFDHGIYHDAFERDIMGIHTRFLNKFFYCFWWGLQSLSSLGQNLEPGTYIWDNFFAIFIVISGLILLALLIGNMQVYLQKEAASNVDSEKQKQERRRLLKVDLRSWDPFRELPQSLQNEIIKCEDENWLRTTEINLKTFLSNTPVELQSKIRAEIGKDLFSEVFAELHADIQKELRGRAKAEVFQARSIIRKEGHPVYEMIYIVEGKALAFSRDNNIKENSRALVFSKDNNIKEESRSYAHNLEKNDIIGKELLEKVRESSEHLPLARETVHALTKLEAFTLSFNDFVVVFKARGNLMDSRHYQEIWARKKIKRFLLKIHHNRHKPEARPQPLKQKCCEWCLNFDKICH